MALRAVVTGTQLPPPLTWDEAWNIVENDDSEDSTVRYVLHRLMVLAHLRQSIDDWHEVCTWLFETNMDEPDFLPPGLFAHLVELAPDNSIRRWARNEVLVRGYDLAKFNVREPTEEELAPPKTRPARRVLPAPIPLQCLRFPRAAE